MAAYKRSDWNELIDEVNDVLTNPPENTDCTPIATLDHVGPDHRWAKSDIREVHEALQQTCPDIQFDEIPDLWKQSIIDEIRDKMGQAWCDCEEEDDDCEQDLIEEDGSEFVLFTSQAARAQSNCLGDPEDGAPISGCSLFNGMQVGRAGIFGRICRIYRRVFYNDGHTADFSTNCTGTVTCQGIAQCLSNRQLATTPMGTFTFCGSCTPACFDAIAERNQFIADHPEQFGIYSYILRIDTDSAVCSPCE